MSYSVEQAKANGWKLQHARVEETVSVGGAGDSDLNAHNLSDGIVQEAQVVLEKFAVPATGPARTVEAHGKDLDHALAEAAAFDARQASFVAPQ